MDEFLRILDLTREVTGEIEHQLPKYERFFFAQSG
jgi:hypothetical protein